MNQNMILKMKMSQQQLMMVESEFQKVRKSKTIALLLWWTLGVVGGHRFYTGDTAKAVCMILFGWLTAFIWNLVDVFFIGKRIEQINEQLELQEILKLKSLNEVEL